MTSVDAVMFTRSTCAQLSKTRFHPSAVDELGVGNQPPRADHFEVRKLPFLLVLIGTEIAAGAPGVRETKATRSAMKKREGDPRGHGD